MTAASVNAKQMHPSALTLLDSIQRLGVPFGCERSCRLSRGSMLADRILLSISKASLGSNAVESIKRIWADLLTPQGFIETATQLIPQAAFFHFGFEQSGESCVYKFYLELAIPKNTAAPVLLHRAIKWDGQDNSRSVTSQYIWHPSISVSEMQMRLARYYGAANQAFAAPSSAMLAVAAQRLSRGSIRFLEVIDDGSPRRSFDLNLYDAGLRVCDVHQPLKLAGERFDIDPRQLQSLYNQIAPMRLGHVAGGLHRDGEPFMTIYYGATNSVDAACDFRPTHCTKP